MDFLIWVCVAIIGGLMVVIGLRKPSKKQTEPSHDCTSCEHYAESRTFERLNPDKTVTPSELEKRWCTKQYNGHFELTDLQPCPMYKNRGKHLPVKRQLNITPPPTRSNKN